eukprot:gene3720-2619_t
MLRASASVLELTSIYDNNNTAPASQSPYAFFLELDDVKLLLDCGWDENFSVEYLAKLKPYAQMADAALISSPQLNACGALPFVLKHLKPGAMVFAAPSTSKIGLHGLLHPFLYNFPNSHTFSVPPNTEEGSLLSAGEDGGGKEAFTLTVDAIYSAFRSIREPFGGKVTIPAKNSPVVCATHFASRMLGGYAWTITYQIDELFYCPDYSMKSSYSLKRFVVPSSPKILLLETFSADKRVDAAVKEKKKYGDQLQNLFRDMQYTLRSGGDVLIPVDVAGRGLEVLNLISQLLREKGGDTYKVVFAAVQAQELLSKASTMTEAFLEDVICKEHGPFSSVVVCKTARDVLEDPKLKGPKVVVADGATTNYGVAGELLPSFLAPNEEGGENLVVLTERPPRLSNAHKVLTAAAEEVVSLRVIRRCPLNEEELEAYYIRKEQEVEEEKERLAKTLTLADDGLDAEDAAASEDDTDDGEAATSAVPYPKQGKRSATKPSVVDAARVAAPKTIPGLYTTPNIQLPPTRAKHLQFVVPAPAPFLQPQQGLDVSYGIPISAEEESILRKLGATKVVSDEGPEGLLLTNDAQMEANLPSKVVTENFEVKRTCRVLLFDLSGYPDGAAAVKGWLKTKFPHAKKIVCLRSNIDNYQSIAKFCEKEMKYVEKVAFAQCADPVDLATPIFSYAVRLDPVLEQQLPSTLKRVRESHSSGDWEVGWVDGCLSAPVRRRTEAGLEMENLEEELVLHSVPEERVEGCAAHRRQEDLDRGSFFVGGAELIRIKDATRQRLSSCFYQKAPLLIYDDGICVRRSADGSITIASLPTPSLFDVRRTVYDQYLQVL